MVDAIKSSGAHPLDATPAPAYIMTPYYEQDGKMNTGQFQPGVKQGPRSQEHRKALSEALKRSWKRGRGGLGFGKGSGVVRPLGATYIDLQGYVMVKVKTEGRMYRQEHIVVMEREIGRSLAAGEVVHHIDGNRQNNEPLNLFLCRDRSHHNRVHNSQDAALRRLLLAGVVVFKEGAYEALL
jgi:hypothetical protein